MIAGCEAVALTDHDGLGGVDQAKVRAEALGIGFVPGCEVRAPSRPGRCTSSATSSSRARVLCKTS